MIEWVFLFLAGVLVSFFSVLLGVSSAVVFTPLFIIVYGLSVPTAVMLSIIVKLVAMSSGVVSFFRAGMVDMALVKKAVIITMPAAVVGSFFTQIVSERIVSLALGVFLLVLGVTLLQHTNLQPTPLSRMRIDFFVQKKEVILRKIDALRLGMGGFLTGLASMGTGEVSDIVLSRYARPHLIAGTTVVILVCTGIASSLVHLPQYILRSDEAILSYVLVLLPSSIIGARLGMMEATVLPEFVRKKALVVTLFVAGTLLLVLA